MSGINSEIAPSHIRGLVDAKRAALQKATVIEPNLPSSPAQTLVDDPILNLLRYRDLTAPIREYLLRQKAAIDQVFKYFDVEGGLRELCTIPFDKNNTVDSNKSEDIPIGGSVKLVLPAFYDPIVNPKIGAEPNPSVVIDEPFHARKEIGLPVSFQDFQDLQKYPLTVHYRYERVTEGTGNYPVVTDVVRSSHTSYTNGDKPMIGLVTNNTPIYETRQLATYRNFQILVFAKSSGYTQTTWEGYNLIANTQMKVTRRTDYNKHWPLEEVFSDRKGFTFDDRSDAFRNFLADQLVKIDPK